MSKRVFNVSLQIDLKSLSAPGVYLCPKGKAFVRICVFGVSEVTKEVDPVFPLVFMERLNFSKTFNDMGSVYELHDKLGQSVITLELVQCPVGNAACIKLATFNALLSDILHPYATCFSKPSDTSGIELLFSKCKMFPGILAPKADVSIAVEVTDTFGEPAARGDTKGKVMSKSVSDEKRRQQPVCHTKDNLRCKCYHDPERRTIRPRKTNQGKETTRSVKPTTNQTDWEIEAVAPANGSDQESQEESLGAWPSWFPWSSGNARQDKPPTAPPSPPKQPSPKTKNKEVRQVRRVESAASFPGTEVDHAYQEEMRRAMEDCDRLLREYSSDGSISDLNLRDRYINCLSKDKNMKSSNVEPNDTRSSSSHSDSFDCSCVPNGQEFSNRQADSESLESFDVQPEYVPSQLKTRQSSKANRTGEKSRQRPTEDARSMDSMDEGDRGRTRRSMIEDRCSCIRVPDVGVNDFRDKRQTRERTDRQRSRTAGRLVSGPVRSEKRKSRVAGKSVAVSRQGRTTGNLRNSESPSDEEEDQGPFPEQGDQSSIEGPCECHRCQEYQSKYNPKIHPCPRFRRKQQSHTRDTRVFSRVDDAQPKTTKETRKPRSTLRPKQSTAPERPKSSKRRAQPKPSVAQQTFKDQEPNRVKPKQRQEKSRSRPLTRSPDRHQQGDAPHEYTCECPHCEEYQRQHNPSKHPCPNFVKGVTKCRPSSVGRSSAGGPKKLISSRKTAGTASKKGECLFSSCQIPPDPPHQKAKHELKHCYWWD